MICVLLKIFNIFGKNVNKDFFSFLCAIPDATIGNRFEAVVEKIYERDNYIIY
jgi:hypothetical protein